LNAARSFPAANHFAGGTQKSAELSAGGNITVKKKGHNTN